MQSKDFDYHINKEGKTIEEFINSSPNIKLRKLMNEGYSTWDFSFQQGNIIYLTEAKTRNCNHDKFSDTILELDKVNRLYAEVCKAIGSGITSCKIKAGFLVKFNDGMYFIDMNKATTTMSIKFCPETTAEDNNANWKHKSLCHYKLDNAIKIN
jgi:hypothetical protein